jgi:paraquat-inducible protein B
MSKQANPAVIGGFVLGALALPDAGSLILGSGKFFPSTLPADMYFEGDLKGLRAGSSVNFQGAPIGTVADIKVVFDPQSATMQIPVIVKFRPDTNFWDRPPREEKKAGD